MIPFPLVAPPFASGAPNPPSHGGTRELPDDIDALDALLVHLRGQRLAMSDGFGTWMRLNVVLLAPSGHKPTAVLSDVEFRLLGHIRHPASGISNCLELTVEGVACGTQGTLRLMFPASGWRLHAVLPSSTASAWIVPPSAWATPRSAAPGADATDPPQSAPQQADAPDQPPTAPPQADADESVRRKRDDLLRRMFS